MKRFYSIFLTALSVIILSWCLPWLYSLIFPAGINDAFVAWSPISNAFVVSEPAETGGKISIIDNNGNILEAINKDQRDSVLPQIYFNQLIAKGQFPDSIKGIEISIPLLKNTQWVFNSLPRDLNRVNSDVYLMMESMPERFDLEDPEVVFRVNDKGIEFVNMATNSVDINKTRRFNEIFTQREFAYPIKAAHANITTRKAYDEGYLIADANGSIYHLKMQAGRPYMAKVAKPDSVKATHLFMLEKTDSRQLGIVCDSMHNLYVLEKDGYKLNQLPIGKLDPEKQKFSIVKNIFNWVVKINDDNGVRWIAFDSNDYSLLGEYGYNYSETMQEKISSFIFPFRISFTSISDCYAKPRIESISPNSLFLNILLAVVMAFILRRKNKGLKTISINIITILIFGIFAFIPLLLIKE